MKDARTFSEENLSGKERVKIALKYLRQYPTTIYKTLPVHMVFSEEGQSVTLPQILLSALENKSEVMAITLQIPASTAAHNRSIALEFIRQKFEVPIPEFILDNKSVLKLDNLKNEYTNYEEYRKFIGSKVYENEHKFLKRLTVGAQNGTPVPFFELLRKRYGWDTPRVEIGTLANSVGKKLRNLTGVWEGGKLFINMVSGTQFIAEDTIYSKDFIDVNLFKFDRYHRAQEYLDQFGSKLLPVERFILEEYLNGKYHRQIETEVKVLTRNTESTFLTATYGNVLQFLTYVFEFRSDWSPFQKLWIADEARKLLSNRSIDRSTKRMLLGIASGKSFKEVAFLEGIESHNAGQRLRRAGIETDPSQAFSNRKSHLLNQRFELLQATYLIDSMWPEKQHDLRVLEYLTGIRQISNQNGSHNDPTFTIVGKEIGISDIQVALSIARIRTHLRREIYKLEEEKT